jgi:GLPGLI family protein
MKNVIIFLIFGLINNLYSQNNKVLKVEYNEIVSYIPSIINYDKGILYVSHLESSYKTIFSNSKNLLKSDDQTLIIQVKDEEYFSEIYLDRRDNLLFENIFERRALKRYYSVYEKLPKMNWELINESKTIENFECKKAKTVFRGRTYVVWYSEEIPISVGPWKFNGLPGIILSVEDSEGIYKWYAKNITYPFEGDSDLESIKNNTEKFTKISFKDLDAKRIESLKLKMKTQKARMGQRNQSISLEFSTSQWKEPVNEFRNQVNFSF